MEGSYSKVWRSRDQVPRDEYRFFVDGLMGTIRREIASCEEKAYDSLPLGDVATLLFFSNLEEVSSMANEVRHRVTHLEVRAGRLTFSLLLVIHPTLLTARMADQPKHADSPLQQCAAGHTDTTWSSANNASVVVFVIVGRKRKRR